MMGLLTLFKQQLCREGLIQIRQFRLVMNACLFFLMLTVFFPLTMPSDPLFMRSIVPGLVWIAVLLAFFLSSERLFQEDYDDGVLEQWLVSGYPLSLFVGAKLLLHWAVMMMPLLLFCPLLMLLFNLTPYETIVILASLLAGTPALLSLCALAAAFGVGLQQRGMFMALILLPLTIPLMIFGSASIMAAMQGLDMLGYLALLLAVSSIAVALMPFAIAGVLLIVV